MTHIIWALVPELFDLVHSGWTNIASNLTLISIYVSMYPQSFRLCLFDSYFCKAELLFLGFSDYSAWHSDFIIFVYLWNPVFAFKIFNFTSNNLRICFKLPYWIFVGMKRNCWSNKVFWYLSYSRFITKSSIVEIIEK